MMWQFHLWEYIHRKQKHKLKWIYAPPMFIEALFRIVKTWRQLKCPLTVKWIKKFRLSLYSVECYSVIEIRNSYHL